MHVKIPLAKRNRRRFYLHSGTAHPICALFHAADRDRRFHASGPSRLKACLVGPVCCTTVRLKLAAGFDLLQRDAKILVHLPGDLLLRDTLWREVCCHLA